MGQFLSSLQPHATLASCVVLNPHHPLYRPGGPSLHARSGVLERSFADRLQGQHLRQRYVLGVVLEDHHYVLYWHRSRAERHEVVVCDPLGPAAAAMSSRGVVAGRLLRWLAEEHRRAALPPPSELPPFVVRPCDAPLPTQRDSVSCGVFACFYAWYFVIHAGTWPTAPPATVARHTALRWMILDACLKGTAATAFP